MPQSWSIWRISCICAKIIMIPVKVFCVLAVGVAHQALEEINPEGDPVLIMGIDFFLSACIWHLK